MGAVELQTGGLLERERELARLAAALESARGGTGAAIVIEADAGLGKTALMRAAVAHAREDRVAVLAAHGTELERELPFGVVRQCLEPVVRQSDDREALLAGAAALAGPVLIGGQSDEQAGSFGVLHGLYWVLANLSERGPLLLAIDDAHWCDEPSLRFLTYLTRRVQSLPVALVIAARPVEPDCGDPGGLSGLMSDPAAEVLSVKALSESAVTKLLSADSDRSVDEPFARACHHSTGGNPFLLAELERALREAGVPFIAANAGQVAEITPPQVARATRARLARLEPAAGALARAVAMLGYDVALDLACELAQLDPVVGARAATALLEAGLLETGRLLTFRHPLLRAAVAASVTPFERDTWHRRAAALLKARGEPAERIATQLLASSPGLHPAEIQTLREAAARAATRGAPVTAAVLLRRALEEVLEPADRAQLLLGLGRCEYVAGQITRATDHLEQAARAADDAILRARAVVVLAQATTRNLADIPGLTQLVAETLEGVRGHDRELALRLQAFALMVGHPSAASGPIGMEDVAVLPGDTPGEAVVLGHLVFRRMVPGASAAEIASLAERAARQVDALLEDGTSTTAFSGMVLGLRWSDHLDTAERVLDRAISIARRRGSTIEFGVASTMRAHVLMRRGMLRDAEADARAALAAPVEESWLFARGVAPLLESLVAQGRNEEAVRSLETEVGARELIDVPPTTSLILARARIRAACGDHAAALADFEEALRRRRRLGELPASWVEDLVSAVASHHALGNRDAARMLLEEALTLARAWDTPGTLGEALHAQAMLGDGGDRIEQLREAVALLERSPARLLHARALIDLGGTLRRAGERVDSREPLRAGYELAKQCGAERLAETARQELASSGVRLRRERLSGVQSLTPSELRIARMAAGGSSNAEIAQALFVTIKTVEAHLSHAYQKLDITRRAQLAHALKEEASR